MEFSQSLERGMFYHKDAIAFGREIEMKYTLFYNFVLITSSQLRLENFEHIFISRHITDIHIMKTANYCPNFLPLYLYPETNEQLTTDLIQERVSNLNLEIVNKIANELNLKSTIEKADCVVPRNDFAPKDILGYIYAVLHAPNYNEKYKEFLKIDFPKIQYPKNIKTFWNVVALGSQI